MNANASVSKGDVERWRAGLDRPPFVDTDRAASMRDGAASLQAALDEGFTDFVVLALMPGTGHGDAYSLRIFSRPRPRPVLMHILMTADRYVTSCLGDALN